MYWSNCTGPDSIHTGDKDGSYHNDRHWTCVGFEQVDDSLVAAEQAGYGSGCGGADAEQSPRHMGHSHQFAAEGHMNAVIILGGEIDGGELAV